MKVAVIGAGAMGGLLAWHLAGSPELDLVVAVRRPEQAEQLSGYGLKLVGVTGERHETRRLSVIVADESVCHDPPDVMFIATKAYSVVTALTEFRSLVGEQTVVVPLQNGVGTCADIAAFFDAQPPPIVRAVTTMGATKITDVSIRTGGDGPTILGPAPGSQTDELALNRAAAVLRSGGWQVRTVANILPYLWEKLLINAAINALSAILGVQNGALPGNPHAWHAATQAAREGEETCLAMGLRLPREDVIEVVRKVAERTALNRSSMLQDLDAGRLTEIDYINGALLREGAARGIATPTNEFLVRLVKALEHERAAPLNQRR